MNLDNRRLVWELQTINQIADGIARLLNSTTCWWRAAVHGPRA